jgi:hypothetical protein
MVPLPLRKCLHAVKGRNFNRATRPTHQRIASFFLSIAESAFRLMPAINPPICEPVIFVR